MSGTTGVRGGHVRALTVDDEPALTELLFAAVTETGRRPCPAPDDSVRVLRAGEDGR